MDCDSEVIGLPGVVTSLWLKGNKGGAGQNQTAEASAGFNFAWWMKETLLSQAELCHKV